MRNGKWKMENDRWKMDRKDTPTKGALILKVQVVPRASQSEIVGEHNGALRVRIAAPPVDGAANEELIRTLARAFKVPRRDIEIISGHSSKIKQVSVKNMTGR